MDPPLGATMLVVVYTPDGYWIGADSARSAGETRQETVCKVHETKFGLLLKSGSSQGTTANGQLYSTDKEVEDLLTESQSAEEFKTNLRSKFKLDVESELVYLVNGQSVTPQTLTSDLFDSPIPEPIIPELTRGVFLFQFSGEHKLGEALLVRPQSVPLSSSMGTKVTYRYSALSIFGWHPIDDFEPKVYEVETHRTKSYPQSIRMLSYAVAYGKSDTWVRTHPKQALLEVLSMGHDDKRDEVAPPYVIVHVTQGKDNEHTIKWINSGACPSWTETVFPDASLEDLRNQSH
jgi:hypothetical protein